MIKTAIVALSGLILASCSVAGELNSQLPIPLPIGGGAQAGAPTTPSGTLNSLAQFTIADLQNAIALAKAQGDDAGAACFSKLLTLVQAVSANGAKGVATDLEIARIIKAGNIGLACQGMIPLVP